VSDTMKHSRPCVACGQPTYRKGGLCAPCATGAIDHLPSPAKVPESYLMACAEELVKRHEAREAALVKLGMRREATC
jgi:hypothetical protein